MPRFMCSNCRGTIRTSATTGRVRCRHCRTVQSIPKNTKAVDPPEDIDAFRSWLRTLRKDAIIDLLSDAYWKRQIEGSELLRSFRNHQAGVDLPIARRVRQKP